MSILNSILIRKNKISTNPYSPPLTMKTPVPYTEEEAYDIQYRLDTKLDASHLSYRPAAQGTVAYLEGWKAFNLANEVFGFNGWSSEILSFTIDFVREYILLSLVICFP